jgi:hypothetical protein
VVQKSARKKAISSPHGYIWFGISFLTGTEILISKLIDCGQKNGCFVQNYSPNIYSNKKEVLSNQKAARYSGQPY